MSDLRADRSAKTGLLLLGTLYALLLLAPNLFGRYELFIDELYYIACSKRLALGYVDHPPLSVFILCVIRSLFGDSPVALRLLPALAGGASVVWTGMLAHRFGAGPFGQMLAGLAVAAAAIPTLFFGFYSMNAFEFLLWTVGAYVLACQARAPNGEGWLAFGFLAGIALLNKHTFVLFALGLAVGLLATPARRAFADRRLWGGVALASILLLPNLLWQSAHGWPSLEFYANADLKKSLSIPAGEVLLQQILFMNPVNVLVWVAGIVYLLFCREGRPWRHMGWAFVVLLALIIVSRKSRPDRIAGAYPIALAAGAVVWERISAHAGWTWIRAVLPAALLVAAAALAPLTFPVLPPEALAKYAEKSGIVPQVEAGEGKKSRLPQWMADRFD
jgi:4-amino-4-deoxy-L-arabinose transferase-like glycosyltransferase